MSKHNLGAIFASLAAVKMPPRERGRFSRKRALSKQLCAMLCIISALTLAVVAGCDLLGNKDDDESNSNNSNNTGDQTGADANGIKWTGDANGTLTVINDSSYDMVVFVGQTPTKNNILGGVKAGSELTLDVSSKVNDFSAGGYMIIRAMRLTEYQNNINNLTVAKIDYSAMATYGEGKKYRAKLISTTDGNFSYRVQNRTEYGLELRKNSTDGEKITYMSPRQTRTVLYSPNSTAMTVWPVYVAYNTHTKTIVTFEPHDYAQSHDIQPKANTGTIDDYTFPPADVELAVAFGNITLPFATINVINNTTRSASFRIGTSTRMPGSNYELVTSGATESYEIPAASEESGGRALALNCGLLDNTVSVPVRFASETAQPVIKNGFVYEVTLTYNGGSGGISDVANYTAVIRQAEKINTSDFLKAQ